MVIPLNDQKKNSMKSLKQRIIYKVQVKKQPISLFTMVEDQRRSFYLFWLMDFTKYYKLLYHYIIVTLKILLVTVLD